MLDDEATSKSRKESLQALVLLHNAKFLQSLILCIKGGPIKASAAAVVDVVVQPFRGKWQIATNDCYYRKAKRLPEKHSLRIL